MWICKNTFKITRVSENNNKKWWEKVNPKYFFNILIIILILALCPSILIFVAIASSHSYFWIWTIDLKLYIDFLTF